MRNLHCEMRIMNREIFCIAVKNIMASEVERLALGQSMNNKQSSKGEGMLKKEETDVHGVEAGDGHT